MQDASFQSAISNALKGTPADPAAAAGPADGGAQDFLDGFLKAFQSGVDVEGGDMDREITSLMTSMLSPELVRGPMEKICETLEPWLKKQKNLNAADKARYQEQLRLYKLIV